MPRPRRRIRARPRRRDGWPRRWLRRTAALLGVLILLPPVSDAFLGLRRTVEGCRVVHVVDGDTVDLLCPGRELTRVRVTGFDAPELFSPGCATEAAQALAAQTKLRWTLARAETLEVIPGGVDRYGRRLAEIRVDGRRLADIMVESGHGRPYDGGARAGWCGA